MIKIFGLIGYPLSHSFSKGYFTEKFQKEGIMDCEYHNFAIENIQSFQNLIQEKKDHLFGLNVTIPYKEKIIPYLDELDQVAKEIGAVNVVKMIRDQSDIFLKGFNSDIYGFSESLKPHLQPHHRNAIVLGTGGASKSIVYALNQLGIKTTLVSRYPQGNQVISYQDINQSVIESNFLIINTSPVGMYPNVSEAPDIPYNLITPNHLLYDLVYNPLQTMFLTKGKEKGAKTVNGLQMLHLQAEKAWKIWNS